MSRPVWVAAERKGSCPTLERLALKADLPSPQSLNPGAVTVAPSSQRPGRHAMPAFARRRMWLYSFSVAMNAVLEASADTSSSVSERRLLWPR